MNPKYVEENAAQRRRLSALTASRSEADLRRDVGKGWSMAAKLVHLAFWDRYALVVLERWEREGIAPSPIEFDAVNDVVRILSAEIPARASVDLALAAADAIDRKLEGISPELEEAVEAAGRGRLLRRSEHRREHLDQIERALKS